MSCSLRSPLSPTPPLSQFCSSSPHTTCADEACYVVFDLPGQVELFMMHDNLKRILTTMVDKWNYRLTAVELMDAHLCTDASK